MRVNRNHVVVCTDTSDSIIITKGTVVKWVYDVNPFYCEFLYKGSNYFTGRIYLDTMPDSELANILYI